MRTTPRAASRTRAGAQHPVRLSVLARPHWVNAWLLRSTARPYLRLNGTEHPLTWGRTGTFLLQPGTHVLEAFWRYRGTRAPLGTGTLRVQVHQDEEVLVEARNGPLNHQPLQLRRRPTT
ncbi:hypothetical protein [Kineococcus sp. SYSU DK018]|uniref:hypothetical protein n=1 Tax=Kineococcus sp. SYSU DK018 TaxID=3383139 RepID=UPI003D7E490D